MGTLNFFTQTIFYKTSNSIFKLFLLLPYCFVLNFTKLQYEYNQATGAC